MTPRGIPVRIDAALIALADPTRRAILARLARGDASVTELAEPFAMSLNAVSKHIRILERARLVARRRAGREHRLSFDPAPLADVASWIQAQQAAWTSRLERLDALLKAEDAARARRPRKGPLKGSSR
jgi:DNA-binding transcriptional ArsR family regulator